MNILVLSCGTGGGHNAVGIAVAEEMKKRGHDVRFEDVYDLVSKNVGRYLSGIYIKISRVAPWLFGFIYSLGMKVSKASIESPVYSLNKRFAEKMQCFLTENKFDAIICSHMFPAHILRAVNEAGITPPKTILIATDYTCHPFMEDSYYDIFVIPHHDLMAEFVSRGVCADKIRPLGIPVKSSFNIKRENREIFELVISGGSMGAGNIGKAVRNIRKTFCRKRNAHITVICGNNERLYRKLNKIYKKDDFVTIIGHTDKMAEYIGSANAFITKPGGISSTEAAVANVPLIHISPIPGCESINAEYFSERHMSINVGSSKRKLNKALESLFEKENTERMMIAQNFYINSNANKEICDHIIGEVCYEKER